MITSEKRSEIVLIDPQKLRQAGFVRLLENWAEANALDVVAISSAEELALGPHCAMVVLSVGGVSVLDRDPQLWIRSIRTVMQDVPLVILSDRETCAEIRAAFREGAKGFIATNLDPSLALEALTFLRHGGSFFPSSVLLEDAGTAEQDVPAPPPERLAPAPLVAAERTQVRMRVGAVTAQRAEARPAPDPAAAPQITDRLTPRQSEVLERLREGKPNKVIARDLNMTEATVKVHVRQIMRKFGAANRTQAALCAMQFAASSPK